MSTSRKPWSVGWLTDFPDARVCAELPADLPAFTIQVVRFGGGRPQIPFDEANVDIDCYAPNREQARTLAEQVCHAVMYSLPRICSRRRHLPVRRLLQRPVVGAV
jgi:hypothetical protein